MTSKLILWALADAVGIIVYVLFVVFIMSHAEQLFRNDKEIIGTLMFLMLFLVSAAITSSLLFGRPVYLFLEGLKREGVKLLLYTLGFLIVFMLIIFATRIF